MLFINEINARCMRQTKIFHFKVKSLAKLFVGFKGLSHTARIFPYYKMSKTDSLS